MDYVLTDGFTLSVSQTGGDSAGLLPATEICFVYKLCESNVVVKNSVIRLWQIPWFTYTGGRYSSLLQMEQ